jgi:hypothetical protein
MTCSVMQVKERTSLLDYAKLGENISVSSREILALESLRLLKN